MKFFRTPEFKVGLLVVVVVTLIGGMSMQVSEDPSYMRGRALNLWFFVKDATGLIKNSVVKMAGVNVGIIKDIELEQNSAKIIISVRGDLKVSTSSSVQIKAYGFLGDKIVDLVLGDPNDPLLVDNSRIRLATKSGSVDDVMNEVSKISQSLADIAGAVRGATVGDDSDSAIGQIVSNLQKLTGDMADIVGSNKNNLNEMITEMTKLSKALNRMVGEEGEAGGLQQAWADATASLRRVESMMANFEEISSKINRGEGTVGRLLNDDTIIEELNTTVTEVNKLINSTKKVQTSFDIHSEFLTRADETKNYLGLRIQPGLDRYYEIAVVDDPTGRVETVDRSVTEGGATTNTTTVTTFRDEVKLTALFAKNFWDFTVKGGLMESSGGVGLDYFPMRNKKLRLSLEAFDFADTNLRAFARYDLWKGVYFIAGGDDLTDTAANSPFFGAGLFLTNEDLKLLLTAAP